MSKLPKTPKGVPEDEFLLANMIAEAKGRDLGWCSGSYFVDASGRWADVDSAVACCARGATMLLGKFELFNPYVKMVYGNDDSVTEPWTGTSGDAGESIGYAFRMAMK